MGRKTLLGVTLSIVVLSSCFILYVLLFLEGQLNKEFEVSKLTFKSANDYLVMAEISKIYKSYVLGSFLCLILNSCIGIFLMAKREKKIGLFILIPSLTILLAVLAIIGLSAFVWDGYI
jgi:hypothetical protein